MEGLTNKSSQNYYHRLGLNLLCLFFAFTWLQCKTANQQTLDSGKHTYRILFVGNSLSYYNNLPQLVQQEAKQNGITINYEILAKPNYAIVDHWAEGEVQKLITSKTYDFVIIQQGPSSQPEGKQMLIRGGKLYSKLCKSNGSKLVYFMVWPAVNYYHTFTGVIENYTLAARLNGALLCPVGKEWKQHFEKTQDFSYYSEDGFHPSIKGSEVAAKSIVKTLFNVDN